MEPDCPESLVASVERLADDPSLTARLVRSARQYVGEHFDRNMLASRYLDVLHQVAGIAASETCSAADTAAEPSAGIPDSVSSRSDR